MIQSQSKNSQSTPNIKASSSQGVVPKSHNSFRGSSSTAIKPTAVNYMGHKINNSFQQSEVMSLMTKRSNYAIQSIPHTMHHTKIASRDYFGHPIKEETKGEEDEAEGEGILDEPVEEGIELEDTGRKPHGFVAKNAFGGASGGTAEGMKRSASGRMNESKYYGVRGSNYYGAVKERLAETVRNIVYNRLKYSISELKKTVSSISQTTRKTPTFNQSMRLANPQQHQSQVSHMTQISKSSVKNRTPPQIRIDPSPGYHNKSVEQDLTERLVGKISRQSLYQPSVSLSPQSKTQRTATRLLFSKYHNDENLHKSKMQNMGYVPFVNKLLYVAGNQLLEMHAKKINVVTDPALAASKINKKFSIANEN